VSVEEAVKLVAQPTKVADLVILDMSLHDGTGLDVLRALRSSPVNHLVPVVVFSASTRDDDVRLSYAYGANAYITKPGDNYSMLVEYVKSLNAFWFSTVRLPP
jgi:CheY-like chemotaxis protein